MYIIYKRLKKLIAALLICSMAGSTILSDPSSHTPFVHAKNFLIEADFTNPSVYADGDGTSATTTPSAITTTPAAVTSSPVSANNPQVTPSPNPATPMATEAPATVPTQTAEPQVYALYIEYLGEVLKEDTLLSKKDFLVTVAYEDNTTATITEYEFISTTYIDTEGDTEISISYKEKTASCIVSYIKDNTKQYYNVYFESNGGNDVYPILSISPGSTIRLPENPTRYGYWFRGWYTDSSFYQEFDPNTKILQDYTLYAKWAEKENPEEDIMSTYLIYDLFDSFFCKLTVDLTDQAYGSHTAIDSSPIDNQTVMDAAKNISSTQNYFAFHLDVMDCSFQSSNPIPVTISIPPEFNEGRTQVFYSPDEKQIMGACQGSSSGIYNYTFYAYHAGTYIVMDVPEIEPTATPVATATPSISISLASQVNVNSQKTAQINFKNFDEDILAPEEITFTWKSSNTKVAKVTSDGIVTGIKAGTAKITVTSEDKQYTATTTIKVVGKKVPIKTLSLNRTKLTLKKGKTFLIKATIKPKNATTKTLRYSSNKKKIATVSAKGRITAKKKGSCVITVKTTDGSGIKKKIKVTVTN